MTGLRERKKRQTRQHIADAATALCAERGFDAVTIAEIAEAADVSVNTVYNYFPAKEDLFFGREAESVRRPSQFVRERRPGESAAEAVLRRTREEIHARSPRIGLGEDHARFLRIIFGSPALMARTLRMQHRTAEQLVETLREEAGAPADDHVPELVATQLMALQGVVFRTAGHCVRNGATPAETAALMLAKLDTAQALLSPQVLDYARRRA